MRETELRGVIPNEEACVERLVTAGARPVFEGRLEDRRFDTPDFALAARDVVLRLRVSRQHDHARATLDLKGPASYEGGFKHRDETSVEIDDAEAMAHILEQIGFSVSREIDRDVRVFALGEAIVRLERFPRMDLLAEVEGPPEAIEQAIATLGLPRETFTTERLYAFVQRYQARTGTRAAISDREAAGEYVHRLEDA
ncbi:MAG TPA: class IV adenylate cyclase [Gemmatimonadaceae bacterium]